MEIVFIRHGQGEHTLNPPNSLKIMDANITDKGRVQAKALFETYPLNQQDLIIVSPTRRTIQTALYWSKTIECEIIVHPAVGPRMFPMLPASRAFPCDQLLSKEKIEVDFPQVSIYQVNSITWEQGINTLSEEEFTAIAEDFMEWCIELNKSRLFIVSHDGTITSYRQFLGESNLTRKDFLGETGSYIAKFDGRK
ncbi:histidine phosphatase family protein [Chengkuizengella axinellae]|uniref:Histidine phosphatase family protein n=1 Tax=Chengkuizengella axinellae TaxID=3064388 RepID=A0ABT9IXU3_9BACL|nr:histidine phosphatase family protein [Chengkuizengella sp. 2205SS18-9]MDP5274145.1 histidine phosphatase family protein [Chengkuizengella sp. 2205SS18-9]